MKRQARLWIAFCLLFSLLFVLPLPGVSANTATLETKTQALIISPQSKNSIEIVGFYQILNQGTSMFQGNVELPLPAGYENIDPGIDPTLAQFTNQTFVVPVKVEANSETGVQGRYVCEFSLNNREAVLSYQFPTDISLLLLQFPVEVQDVTFVGEITIQDAGSENNVHSYVAEKVRAGQTLEIHYQLKENGLEKFKQIQKEAAAAQNTDGSGTNSDTTENSGSTTNQVTRNSPAFHTAGHIRLWKTSVLGNFDPHIFLILMSVIVVAGISFFGYFTAKRRQEEKKVLENKEEQEFQQLVKRKRAIMEKIVELEEKRESSKVSEEEFVQKNLAYKQLLVQVNQELNKFLD